MNKSIFTLFWSSVFFLFLFACSRQDSQSPVTSPNTTLASVTAIPTQTETRPTLIPTETPTFTPTPYPTKQVLLNYELRSSPRPPFHQNLGNAYSMLVLYSDGQLIVTDETFRQKILTGDEKAQFLSQLENLGFDRIESNQKHDPTDKLYDFGSSYDMEEIGSSYCVVVPEKARELCAYEPYRDFLVPEMKNILNFLDSYQPEGMTLYSPDRLLLKIGNGRNPNIHSLPDKPTLWPTDFPSLETVDNTVLYVEGEMASEVFAFLEYKLTPRLVTQNGLEYTIEYSRPVLPHEVLVQP